MTSYIMRATFATEDGRITPDTTIGELTERFADTVRLFRVSGIDAAACSALPLSAVAQTHRLDLGDLLRAVTRAAERS